MIAEIARKLPTKLNTTRQENSRDGDGSCPLHWTRRPLARNSSRPWANCVTAFVILFSLHVLEVQPADASATVRSDSHNQVSSAAVQSPTLAVRRDGARVRVEFNGTLQSAESATGPWIDATDAVSPMLETPTNLRKFYRAIDPLPPSIFSSTGVANLTVTGPLQAHFDLAFAGAPDGIFPPVRQKPYFDAALSYEGREIPVSMRVRGNSSLQECPFPKLKFKVSREERAGTPFADAREVKIGTHCAEGGRGNIGRLRDERAAFREALVYETMQLLGFISPRVRRAQIAYRDTAPADDLGAGGWQVKRNALLLDDIEVVAERLGGRALSDEELAALSKAAFDEQLVVELHLFHALVGNWDFALSPGGEGVSNTDVIEVANGQLLPVAGDFDLASWVTGQVRSSAPRDYRPDLPDVEREALYQVETLQNRFSDPMFSAAVARFVEKRTAIESQIGAAAVDDEGRANAVRHVKAFYDALAAGVKASE
jgi:hypothetical protein